MAIGIGDNDPTNSPGSPGPTYGSVGEVPALQRGVATGYGNGLEVSADIMRQNMMNSWQNNFAGGIPMNLVAGGTGLNQNFGLGRSGPVDPGQGGWSVDPATAYGILGGVGGFMLGGPAGAYAGYQAGHYLGGQGGGNSDPAYLGGSSSPGQPGYQGNGGTGTDPAKLGPGGQISYGGVGSSAEADRLTNRGNVIGDAWQNNYGTPNQQRMQGIGDAYGNIGGDYAGAAAGDSAAAGFNRQQLSQYGSAGYGMGNSQFGQSDMYGGMAQGDYQRQQALGGQQQQSAGASGLAGASMFQQGQGYGMAAQGDASAGAMARLQQLGAGQQGSAYGAGNMGTAGQYGMQAGQAAQGLQGTQRTQMGLGQNASGVSAANQGTSNALLGQANQAYGAQAGARGDAQDAIGRLQSFYQQGPGPSAAQAQLQQSSEANMSSALALARSGRGAGQNASAMRQAQFQNAATQQQTGQQMAQLRAQEASNWRGQQLGAMGQEQSALGNMRGQDLSAQQQALGSAGQFAGLGYQGMGLGAQQANTVAGQQLGQMNAYLGAQGQQAGLGYQGLGLGAQQATAARGQDIQSQGQNLGAQQSMYGLGFQGLGQQQSGLQGARGQDLQAYGANIGAQQGMGQLGYQGYGMGLNAASTAGQQALASAGQNQQQGLGYATLGQNYQNIGLQNQLGYASMANQQYQSADQLRAQVLNAQLQSDTARYGADRGVQVGMAQLQAQQQAALIGAVGAGIGALSDIRSKKNIKAKPFNGLLGDLLSKGDDEERAPAAPKAAPQYMNPYGAPPPPAGGQMGTMALNMPGAAQPPLPGNPAQDLAMQGLNVPVGSDERGKTAISRLEKIGGGDGYVSSPREAKREIRPVSMAGAPSDYADAWRGVSMQDSMAPPQAQQAPSFSARPIRPGADLRPAKGYSYEYKNPQAPGAAPGRHYGPMAQDLEKTPAGRSVVHTGPDGMKGIDTDRLSLVNTSAISEQQRRLDRLEQIAGDKAKVPLDALDAAYARETADTGVRSDERSKKNKKKRQTAPQLPAAANSDLEPSSEQLAQSGERPVDMLDRNTTWLPQYESEHRDSYGIDQDSVDSLGTAADDQEKRRIGRYVYDGRYDPRFGRGTY